MAVAQPASAQESTSAVIRGRVTTDQGQPIEGALVSIPSMNISVGTTAQGNYTITIPEVRVSGQAADITARFIGRTPLRKPIRITAGSQTVDFQLAEDPARLADIVVTGVATGTERAKLPFDVAKVDASELPAPTLNPLNALQGRVPGANIVSTTGRPGQAPQVLLRAPTSINGSDRGQNPLYVVDGIILAGELPDINASDIESVEVIKGAAATSLYGARAGNGVIQISTKRGFGVADNQLKFGVRTEYGVSGIERQFPLAENHIYRMNTAGTAFCGNAACTTTFNWVDEVLRLNSVSTALPAAPAFSPVQLGTTVWNRFQTGRWPGQTFNAIDQVVDPGPFAQLDGHMQGKFNQTQFFVSLGTLNQSGSFVGLNGFQRGSARMNVDQTIGSDWNVQLSSYYSRSRDDGAGQEGASFFDLTRMPRGVDLFMRDSVQNQVIIRPDLQSENENPVYALLNLERKDQRARFLGGINARYQPVTWFDLRAEASYDRRDNRFSQFNDKGFRTVRSSATNLGQVFEASSMEQSTNGALTGAVRKVFNGDLGTSLSLRLAYEQQDLDNANATGRDLAVKGTPDLDNARSPQIFITSGESSVRRLGGFLNGTVDYKDRYYFDGLLRRDGSSLFGADNRWQTFGRLGASWRITREPWFGVPGIDELKLRYAVGTAGNSPRFDAQYETYTLNGGSFAPFTAGNRDLGPELLTEHEAGIDGQFFNRVGATVTYSNVTTKDQILLVPLPAAAGFQFQWQNAATLKGNTWEASLDIPWVQRPDLSFSTRFTFDRSRATISELNVPDFQYGVNAQALEVAFFAREGERYGTIYGTKWAKSCAELQAGTDCSQFRTNSDGYFVWTNGADPGSGATRNPDGSIAVTAGTWGTTGPTVNGRTLMWGAPVPAQNADGDRYLPLGNTLPDYRWALAPTLTYKKFTATGLVDASQGRVVYNQGRHWSYFENYSADQDMADAPNHLLKPVGYFGSAPGLYDVLQPNSHFVEDGSFVKLREMTLSYHLGRLAGSTDWTVSLIGRNLKTWTKYTGFDPEVGRNGGDTGSGVVNAFDAFTFPNLRTFTLGLSASF